jgi:hypothetical protein
MPELDDKPYGEEAEDQATGDQGVAMATSIEFDGRPAGSAEYDGTKLPYEQEVHNSVSKSQLANVGRK